MTFTVDGTIDHTALIEQRTDLIHSLRYYFDIASDDLILPSSQRKSGANHLTRVLGTLTSCMEASPLFLNTKATKSIKKFFNETDFTPVIAGDEALCKAGSHFLCAMYQTKPTEAVVCFSRILGQAERALTQSDACLAGLVFVGDAWLQSPLGARDFEPHFPLAFMKRLYSLSAKAEDRSVRSYGFNLRDHMVQLNLVNTQTLTCR